MTITTMRILVALQPSTQGARGGTGPSRREFFQPTGAHLRQANASTALSSAAGKSGRVRTLLMGRILASLFVAASLVSLASTEASAWVCQAAGVGSGGWARSYSIIDAKLGALRRCEHHSPVPICTILWCRPGF